MVVCELERNQECRKEEWVVDYMEGITQWEILDDKFASYNSTGNKK